MMLRTTVLTLLWSKEFSIQMPSQISTGVNREHLHKFLLLLLLPPDAQLLSLWEQSFDGRKVMAIAAVEDIVFVSLSDGRVAYLVSHLHLKFLIEISSILAVCLLFRNLLLQFHVTHSVAFEIFANAIRSVN